MIHLLCLCQEHPCRVEHVDEELLKASTVESTIDHDTVTCPRCLRQIAIM